MPRRNATKKIKYEKECVRDKNKCTYCEEKRNPSDTELSNFFGILEKFLKFDGKELKHIEGHFNWQDRKTGTWTKCNIFHIILIIDSQNLEREYIDILFHLNDTITKQATQPDSNGLTPVVYACHKTPHRCDIIRPFIQHKAVKNVSTNFGILNQIIYSSGCFECFKKLEECGEDIDKVYGGVTPLCVAIKHKRKEIIDYLLKKCVRVQQYRGMNHSPLSISVYTGDINTTNRIIKRGAFPDTPLQRSFTPMKIAAAKGDWRSICLLLENYKEHFKRSWSGNWDIHYTINFLNTKNTNLPGYKYDTENHKKCIYILNNIFNATCSSTHKH